MSSHILSSSTTLCVFIVSTSHNPFISPNLSFLVSFLFPFNQSATLCPSLFFLFFFFFSSVSHTSNIPITSMASFLPAKGESALPAPLKARTPLVLHKAGLMRSLGTLFCPYENPGTLLVYSFLRCPMARPFHPLTPGYSLKS